VGKELINGDFITFRTKCKRAGALPMFSRFRVVLRAPRHVDFSVLPRTSLHNQRYTEAFYARNQ
jgi:hypothetical protein